MSTWHRVPLTALASYVNGYPFKPEDHVQDGWPIIRIEQLKDPETKYDYFDGKVPRDNYIADGDLIFSWSASLFLRIWNHGPAILNQHLFKVVPNPDIDTLFLKYCIEHNLPELTKASHGSTMQHITRRELERFHVEVPSSKTEQTAIADILATVDRAIEQTEALIAKQRRIKAGLLHDLLTRGIDEHGHLRDPSTHRFKPSPVGLVPEEWEVGKVGDLFSMELGKMLSKASKHNVFPKPYLANKNVQWGRIDLSDLDTMDFHPREQVRYRLKRGDILICEGGEVGRTALWNDELAECYFQKAIHRLRPLDHRITPAFMVYYMQFVIPRGVLLNLTTQTSIAHLTQEQLAVSPVVFPGLDEMYKIIAILATHDEVVRKLEADHAKLHRLRTGLMQDLLSGRVSIVPFLKPSD